MAPSVLRRLACMVYESLVLFAVLFITAYLYSSLTQQRHALQGKWGLQAFLFVILGIYFSWFWSHGGQTVAMRAWDIRLVDPFGQPPTAARALCRYLASWCWLLPALIGAHLLGLSDLPLMLGMVVLGVVGYAWSARLHPQQQFWHDALCDTRLVSTRGG